MYPLTLNFPEEGKKSLVYDSVRNPYECIKGRLEKIEFWKNKIKETKHLLKVENAKRTPDPKRVKRLQDIIKDLNETIARQEETIELLDSSNSALAELKAHRELQEKLRGTGRQKQR